MEDRYYIGYDERGNAQVFGWDEAHEPTPDETGYVSIEGPFDSFEVAKAVAGE